jgi:predicted ATP-binding protein involved in virulence
MKYLKSFTINNHRLNIQGKNLIITGNNGAGKTVFLNELYNQVKKNIDLNKLKKKKNNYSKFVNISKEINTYKDVLDIDEDFLKDLDYILSNEEILPESAFKENIEKIYSTYNRKFLSFLTEYTHHKSNIKYTDIYTNFDPKDDIESQLFYNDNSKKYFFNKIEHIKNSKNIIEKNFMELINQKINISFYDPSSLKGKILKKSAVCLLFTASRLYFPETHLTMGNYYNICDIEYYKDKALDLFDHDLEGSFERYIIEERKNLLNSSQSNKHKKWLNKVENDLRFIFENNTIQLSFDDKNDRVLIIQNNGDKFFGLNELPSGFKAIFNIYSSLLMRTCLLDINHMDLEGIVIIDEIDVHLHISLQKKILPFLIRSFPEVQFIVSTHSPFVITSTSDTVVYDISSGEFFEEDLSRYSYEAIIKGLFHVNPISSEINESIETLKDLLNERSINYDNIRSIVKGLIQLERNGLLDKKLKNLYLQAINLLADHNQLEDLDV